MGHLLYLMFRCDGKFEKFGRVGGIKHSLRNTRLGYGIGAMPLDCRNRVCFGRRRWTWHSDSDCLSCLDLPLIGWPTHNDWIWVKDLCDHSDLVCPVLVATGVSIYTGMLRAKMQSSSALIYAAALLLTGEPWMPAGPQRGRMPGSSWSLRVAGELASQVNLN